MSVTRIFTFGYGQTCPFTGTNLVDHHVVITAPTEDLCQDLMQAMFDQTWSSCYESIKEATSNGLFPSVEHMRIDMPAVTA